MIGGSGSSGIFSVSIASCATLLTCGNCNTPVAEVLNGKLHIKSRHHGERHSTSFSLLELMMAGVR